MRRYPKRGGQFAIIWVDLLYEDSVPQSAKILFGEIYRLSDADGYCDASNQDFMDLLGCSETTVRNLLKSLVDVGQIRIESTPRRSGKGGTERRIFCARKLAPPGTDRVPAENCGDRKNLRGVPAENCGDTYLKSNKKNNNPLPPKHPQEVLDAFRKYAGDDVELLEACMGFIDCRAQRKNPMLTSRAANTLINKLKRASKNRKVQIAMLDNATERNWDSVYPLKPDELAQIEKAEQTARVPRFIGTEIVDGEERDIYA